jgi:uncharacterized protein with von Willebrand factor type A (vWA) domain
LIDGQRLLSSAVGFARELRAAGVGVGISESQDFVRALGLINVGDRDVVRAASRAIYVRRHDDIATHDEVFDAYWLRLPNQFAGTRAARTDEPHRGRMSPREGPTSVASPTSTESAGGPGRAASERAALVVARRTYSAEEVFRRKDFDRMSADELRQSELLVDRLAVTLEHRPARRYVLHAHGTQLAPRPMLRRSVGTGGELLEWLWRRPRVMPRPVTLLIDVSGSMDAYARLLLRFAHALARVNRNVEVFVFGTRLTRVTRQLRARNVDDALRGVSEEVADWSGGTRIGESLREFNRRWARRVSPSNSIVVVLSDGWDRGDPSLVGEQTARLRRNSHRLLWLNPLAGAAGFEPLAAGMAAAARHVDRLIPAGSLANLDDFVRLLADTRWGAKALPHASERG